MIDQKTRTAIEAEQHAYEAAVARIRADQRLSPQGRRDAIARVYTRSTTKVDAHKAAAATETQRRRANLERRLFGLDYSARDNVSAAISLRDAQDRASRVPPGDERGLVRLMEQALRVGDELLAKATLERAWDMGSNEVVNLWLDANPKAQADVDAYIDLRGADAPSEMDLQNGSGLGDLGAQFADFLTDYAASITKPTELARYRDEEITAMAAGEDVAYLVNLYTDQPYPAAAAAGVATSGGLL